MPSALPAASLSSTAQAGFRLLGGFPVISEIVRGVTIDGITYASQHGEIVGALFQEKGVASGSLLVWSSSSKCANLGRAAFTLPKIPDPKLCNPKLQALNLKS